MVSCWDLMLYVGQATGQRDKFTSERIKRIMGGNCLKNTVSAHNKRCKMWNRSIIRNESDSRSCRAHQ